MSPPLQDIPADSELGLQLLQHAYSSLMSSGFDKARIQTGSVALQRHVAGGKLNSPVTLYAKKLDEGNELEIAIEPARVAVAFGKPESAVWQWLEYIQGLLIAAKPKTAEKYPRVGIVSEAALDTFIASWQAFLAGRKYRATPTPAIPKLSPLQISELAKAATDQGFDLSPVEDGNWLLCRSTQFPERVWLTVADGGYQLASDSPRIVEELAREDVHMEQSTSLPSDAHGAAHLAEYGELYQLLGRIATLAKTAPDRLVEEFAAATQSLPESTEVEQLVKQRIGQDIFRNALIAFWQGRCAVTGLSVLPLLRASHVKPWAECANNQERLDVFNGLLLAPHLDALFDGGWITFDDAGGLVKSPLLDDTAVQLLAVGSEMKLSHLAADHHPYLEHHRQYVFKTA